MPISKRDRLAHELARLGVLRLLESVALRWGLLVVNYHRIGNCENNRFDDGVFSASAEAFEAQVVYLRKHFRLLTLTELLEFSRTGFPFPEPCALITFDDGYRDNFDRAFPILRKHNASAVFFVPTDYIENPHLPWWDHIAYVVKTTKCRTLALKTNPPVTIDLTTTSRKDAIFQILQVFKMASKANEAVFLSQLEEAAEVQVDRTALGRELFMSWSDLRRMVAAGMSIGSHTHTHQILAQLSETQQHYELKLSKEILQERLQQPVDSISYPVGVLGTFTTRTKQLSKDSGYQIGFAFYGGINRPGQTDPFEIKRIGIDATDTLSLSRTRIVFMSTFGKSI